MSRHIVTIRTDCKACAMAIAWHMYRMRGVSGIFVQDADDEWCPSGTVRHQNTLSIEFHDGSPMACPDHGVVADLRVEPGASAESSEVAP